MRRRVVENTTNERLAMLFTSIIARKHRMRPDDASEFICRGEHGVKYSIAFRQPLFDVHLRLQFASQGTECFAQAIHHGAIAPAVWAGFNAARMTVDNAIE